MLINRFRGLLVVSMVAALAYAGPAAAAPDRPEVGAQTGALVDARDEADRGDAEAQFHMGLAYTLGDGVEEDEGQAATWWRKAAEQGHADSQYNLCQLYTAGQGVPEDDEQAAAWCLKAAEQGVIHAQYNLGWMHAEGRGVPVDLAQSAAWYTKAAAKGHGQARANLGKMYQHGEGVDADPAIAYALFKLASADDAGDGLGIAADRAALLESMSSEQISAGDALAERMLERKVDTVLEEQGE